MSGLAQGLGDLDPIAFAVKFTRTMRRQRSARHVPSLRTAVAIPRLLAARALRVGAVGPLDLIAAAVRCTPPDDQLLAEAVARAIVFPEATEPKRIEVVAPEAVEPSEADPLASVLQDLAALDVDLESLGALDDVEALLEEDPELGAFDLFEHLYSSADPRERALGELVHHFGGPAELEAEGMRTRALIEVWVVKRLLASVGELPPEVVAHGVTAGFGPELRRACTQPWELAGVLAGQADPSLDAHLSDLLDQGASRDHGRTLAYLGPHPGAADRRQRFADAAMARALDLTDFAELLVGLGDWHPPPDALIDASIAVHPRRALEAARWLEQTFGIDIRTIVFERWLATQSRPDLGQLALLATPCPAWERALVPALAHEMANLDGIAGSPGQPLPRPLDDARRLCHALMDTELDPGREAARELATCAMVAVPIAEWFLPLLDALLEKRARPHVDPVLARARALGIDEAEVLDRLGDALEQLRLLVMDDSEDASRYQRLVAKLSFAPEELMQAMCAQASSCLNLTAMAALLAVDMGAAASHLTDEQVLDALGYKGIGGGSNLLRQWYQGRDRLRSSIAATIKEQARAALLDASLEWAGKGGGSGARGLVPQRRTRPFQAGDGLDLLDLESTLETIVGQGKSLDQVTEEDLFASETARGQAALAVLIDISGSMGAGELAVCAIAVVMLLGRLLPEEVALAVFESDTHVLKEFADATDLDEVADKVLDMRATGGTRVDAALSWATEQLGSVSEADVRVLFLLSDFAFAEDPPLLRRHGTDLRDLGARLLGASHRYVHQPALDALVESSGGEHLTIADLETLPLLLLESLERLGS